MIDPRHDCWSTRRFRSEVISQDGKLMCSGTSLRVLLHAFASQDLVWYSHIYGAHDDNCIALAVDRETAGSLENFAPEADSLFQTALGEGLQLEEHPLTPPVQSALGVVVNQEEFHEGNGRLFRYLVYIHDGCFSSVERIGSELKAKLIDCILRQHSFYLKRNVDWSGVLAEIVGIVNSAPAVEFRSQPARQRLLITCKSPGVQMFEALFVKRRRYVVDTSSEPARFLRGPSPS